MVQTILVNTDTGFSSNLKNLFKSEKTIKLVDEVYSHESTIQVVIDKIPELIIINFDSIATGGLFLIRELLQMSKTLKILFITSGIDLNAQKQLDKLYNIEILYKPFDSKMFNEKLVKLDLLT